MKIIYTNGNFYTFEETHPQVEAVVVENGHFVDMGTTTHMLAIWEAAAEAVIDLAGQTVTPGLIDSHLHMAAVAGKFIDLDVTGMTSKAEMLQALKQKATTIEPGQWLIGSGWDENLFTDGGIPTIEELNEAVSDTPLYMSRICIHAFLVNQKALDICGIDEHTPIPVGGEIVRDQLTNHPTGLLLESASELITKHIPEKSFETLKEALRRTIQFAMEKGLTSVHTNDPAFLGGLKNTYHMYDELLNDEQLGLRCNLLIDHTYLDELRKSGMYAGYGNDTLQIGAVKVFADGALGRRTALLSEPYADDSQTKGEAMFDQATLYDIVKKARDLSMPIAVHTIGDQALANVLDILDQLPTVAHRDRLIHVQIVNKSLIKRLAEGNRIADIQPRFVVGDFPWVEERLGVQRTKQAYAWKTLMDAGVLCAGGSDAPVEPVDPLLGIHAAVTRKIPGESHDGYNPDEKLSIKEAFHLFTKYGAYATNEETIKGTIARGKYADMTVYSQNPFTMKDPDDLLNIHIEKTIIGGRVTYRRHV